MGLFIPVLCCAQEQAAKKVHHKKQVHKTVNKKDRKKLTDTTGQKAQIQRILDEKTRNKPWKNDIILKESH